MIQVSLGVKPKNQTNFYNVDLPQLNEKVLEFSSIDHAHFYDGMVMASVEFDKDNTIYVLVPEEALKSKESVVK